MPRLESLRSRAMSTGFLSSAHWFAERLQPSLERLGGASNLLMLTGVGANFLASYLSGLMIEGAANFASNGKKTAVRYDLA